VVTGRYIALTLDHFRVDRGFSEVQAMAHSSRIELLHVAAFRLRGDRATFPLLGERSGAVTCWGDNRSTDIFSFVVLIAFELTVFLSQQGA
jgi:hypothetical protein